VKEFKNRITVDKFIAKSSTPHFLQMQCIC